MKETYANLNIEDIEYDTENPRIKMALEKYGDKMTPERIYFALRSAADDDKSTSSSFNALKDSIRASKGVMVPITVIVLSSDKGGKKSYKCIDGNTRLAIYRQLCKEDKKEDWTEIKSIILNESEQSDIEKIRVCAHLVGARAWPAYEKARYLQYLHSQEFMDYGEIIQLCGGNKNDIERQINAYNDMNKYYRDVVDDTAFHIDRFSGFVELQKSGIQDAIFDAGLDLNDFGQWIKTGMIRKLATVRQLPQVLRDKEAKQIFLKGGPGSIEDAIQTLGQRKIAERGVNDADTTLESASILRLAETLTQRINNMTYGDFCMLQDRADDDASDQIASLETLSSCLQGLLDRVAE